MMSENFVGENYKESSLSEIPLKRNKSNKKRKIKSAILALFKFSLFFVTVLVVIVIITLLWIRASYLDWKNEFERKIVSEQLYIFNEDGSWVEKRESLNGKVESFSKSENEVDTLVLSQEDVAILLSDSLNNSLPNGADVKKIYIESREGSWNFYILLNWNDRDLPWLSINVLSESFESAEIFAKEVYVGNVSLRSLGFEYLIDDINAGYRDALLFVNENNVGERRFQNISLQEDEIVVKGRR